MIRRQARTRPGGPPSNQCAVPHWAFDPNPAIRAVRQAVREQKAPGEDGSGQVEPKGQRDAERELPGGEGRIRLTGPPPQLPPRRVGRRAPVDENTDRLIDRPQVSHRCGDRLVARRQGPDQMLVQLDGG